MNKFLTITLSALLFLSACSKENNGGETPPEASYDCTLTDFSFSQVENGTLKSNANGIASLDGKIYITVDQEADLTSLIPSFKIHEKAIATIDGKSIESKKSPIDFSKTQTIKVISESGKSAEYTILCKNGMANIDNHIYNFMIRFDIPGVSVALTKDEEIAYSAGYGFANYGAKERTTPNHLFRLASVSKQQTALCIMKLYEQGKLQLNDKVFGEGGILEAEFGKDGFVNGTTKVTVKHLLQHTSGWTSSPDPMFTDNTIYAGKNLDERITYVIKNVAQTNEPGTKYSYYNLGFGILGKIVEKLSGKDFETFLKEEIHAKAGVSDIHVGGNKSNKRPNEVIYYSQSGTNGYGNDMEMIKAAGGIIASAPELMKLMCCVDYGTKVPDILKKETLDLMYTPCSVYERYGLGWRLNHSSFTDWASYHSGNLAGTATIWERGANGIHAVILCNSRSYAEGFDDRLYVLLHEIQTQMAKN